MDCKEAQLLITPYIMGDLDSDSRHDDLEAHLRSCRACSWEYKAIKEIIGLIDGRKSVFAEALDAVERRRVAQKEQMKRSWQAIEAELAKTEAREKPKQRLFAFRRLWEAGAIAACLAIGISLWMAFSNNGAPESSAFQPESQILAGSVAIEMLLDEGVVSIPAGREISTSADELKTLVINGRHRLTMNADSTISIEPFEQNSRFGCMVKLDSGEIFARVEHDSNPFVVNTPHGRAVITGTVFDVKTGGDGTTLVVSEGTVRFGSEKGVVEVKSGQFSRIFSHFAPTKPRVCDIFGHIAWAKGQEIETFLQKTKPLSDDYDLSELWLTASSGRVDLEAIDYADWVEEKRNWFEREFPWIFELQKALAKEGKEVDYAELLLKSGDFRQFVYPQTSPSRIAVLSGDSLLKVASSYGFDKEWLGDNVHLARYAALESGLTGLKAFGQWEADLEKASKLSGETIDSGTLLCSLHSSTYVKNTRILIWLGLKNGRLTLRGDRAKILDLLDSQVNAANELTGRIIRLFAIPEAPCEEYQVLIGEIMEDIGEITSIEKEILEYEGGDKVNENISYQQIIQMARYINERR